MTCPSCNKEVRTQSELKKHNARHTRPFKCPWSGCPKADEGFATQNDLDRHKRSVHKLGDGMVYRCHLDQCKDNPKDWPRPDNFRQHLKRVHKLENPDLKRFEFQSSESDVAGHQLSEAARSDLPMASGSPRPSETLPVGTDQVVEDPVNIFGSSFPEFLSNMDRFSFLLPLVETGSPWLSDQNSTESPDPITSLSPSVLGMARSTMEGAPLGAEPSSEANPTTLNDIAPDMPTQGSAVLRPLGPHDGQTRQTAGETVSLDGLERPEGIDGDDRDVETQADEVVSNEPDVMDVDRPAPNLGAEEHDSGLEENESAESSTDSHSDLLRNAGTQHLKIDGGHFEASSSGVSRMELEADNTRPDDLDDTQADAIIKALIEKGKLDEILKKYGYLGKSDQQSKDTVHADASPTPDNNGSTYRCPECPKSFHQGSQLKKHQMRHIKPYACTFPDCDKKFGSKSDWKRHEASQHSQIEIWRCAERRTNGLGQEECGKVCHSSESLRAHLEKDHGIRHAAVLGRKLADWPMDRDYEFRFWCGFCQKTIELTSQSGSAHSQRFDHIDDHYNGRNNFQKADISDWKYVDAGSAESPTRPQGKSGGSKGQPMDLGGKTHKRGHDGGGDDGSSRSKRRKHGKEKMCFWTCCSCGGYWAESTTPKCITPGCSHVLCERCNRVAVPEEDEVPTLDPGPGGTMAP
ncbi:hypothetical protein VTH06DRAFT_2309 [Thermothelomyces fergusii]